jgi:hypothetical protein
MWEHQSLSTHIWAAQVDRDIANPSLRCPHFGIVLPTFGMRRLIGRRILLVTSSRYPLQISYNGAHLLVPHLLFVHAASPLSTHLNTLLTLHALSSHILLLYRLKLLFELANLCILLVPFCLACRSCVLIALSSITLSLERSSSIAICKRRASHTGR